MAKVVAVVGTKGGSGKSSIAHLLGHGAGSLPRMVPAVVLTTDRGERVRTDPRRYVTEDARTPDALIAHVERLLPVERLLIVVDGAAAREDIDAVVADVADVAVLPFGPAEQDVERALDDMARMPKAVALPNRWPRHPGTAKRARHWLEMVPEGRRMPPFPMIPKLDGLLSEKGNKDAAYEIASPARNLLLEVLALGRIDPDDIAATTQAA
jgi:chromosome partitioning protein